VDWLVAAQRQFIELLLKFCEMMAGTPKKLVLHTADSRYESEL